MDSKVSRTDSVLSMDSHRASPTSEDSHTASKAVAGLETLEDFLPVSRSWEDSETLKVGLGQHMDRVRIAKTSDSETGAAAGLGDRRVRKPNFRCKVDSEIFEISPDSLIRRVQDCHSTRYLVQLHKVENEIE